jgi:putative PIN family toxin of toxin-antitoxin system
MKKQRSEAEPRYRAVFDTNVYVAKALSKNPRSPNVELFKLQQTNTYLLLWCDEICAEIAEKLLARGLSDERIAEFIAEVMSLALWIEVPASAMRRYVADDPDDDIFVACAIIGKATHIVSYDPHLRNLLVPLPDCTVIDSLHFLFLVRGDKPPLRMRLRNWFQRLLSLLKL